MDDITPGMKWERFDRFRRMFERHGVKPLIGIVPENCDPNLDIDPPNPRFWDIMRELKSAGWSIAQHGYQHRMLERNGGLLRVNSKSEFAGRPYGEQVQRIAAGREILTAHGLATDVFMAPWHAYDESTIAALVQTDFRVVTDGYALYPYARRQLRFIPCQIARPPKISFGVFTVCLHSDTATDETLQSIDSYLANERERVKDFNDLLAIPPVNGLNRLSEPLLLGVRRMFHIMRKGRRV